MAGDNMFVHVSSQVLTGGPIIPIPIGPCGPGGPISPFGPYWYQAIHWNSS